MKNESATANRKWIRFERTYDGPVDDLWDLWTTKDGFESWWTPEGCRVEVSTIEPRLGGKLVSSMIPIRPEEIAEMKQLGLSPQRPAHATFVEFEPKRRLRLRHRMDFIPNVEPYDHDILVEFIPDGTRVRMVVEIEPHWSEHWTQLAVQAFEYQLTRIPTALAARRGA